MSKTHKAVPKESIIRPCSKSECSVDELLGLCRGVFPVYFWAEGKEELEQGILSVSDPENTTMKFCLWKKGNKLKLIQRFNIPHSSLAQIEACINFSRFVKTISQGTKA
jgi:hypothetical protein